MLNKLLQIISGFLPTAEVTDACDHGIIIVSPLQFVHKAINRWLYSPYYCAIPDPCNAALKKTIFHLWKKRFKHQLISANIVTTKSTICDNIATGPQYSVHIQINKVTY